MAVGRRSRQNIKENLRYEKERDREKQTKPLIKNIDVDDESDGELKLSKLIKDTRGKRDKQTTKKEILEITDETPERQETSDVRKEIEKETTSSNDKPKIEHDLNVSDNVNGNSEVEKESSVIDKQIEEMEKTKEVEEPKPSVGKVVIEDKNKSSKLETKVYEKEKRYVRPEDESDRSDDVSNSEDDVSGSEDEEESEYISKDEQIPDENSESTEDDNR